jgi:hypothetical protein
MQQVTWRDTNFRGLGDTLDFTVTTKEGFEDGMLNLGPALKMKWQQNGIGRDSTVAVSHEEDSTLEYLGDILTTRMQGLCTKLTPGKSAMDSRLPVRCYTTALHLSRYVSM